MKSGIIKSCNYVVSENNAEDWLIHGFTISPSEISFTQIPHSGFATPGRYIEEIYSRLQSLETGEGYSGTFIFNPVFDIDRLGIALVYEALQRTATKKNLVFCDKNGLPVGYFFANPIPSPHQYLLRLLSTVDSTIDTAICRELFGETDRLSLTNLDASLSDNNGFLYATNRETYRWLGTHTLRTLKAKEGKNAGRINLTAYLPYHAGDVLFFVLAFRTAPSNIEKLALNQAYAPIAKDVCPDLPLKLLQAPLFERSENHPQGKFGTTGGYFEDAKADLSNEDFIYFCHHSRDSNAARFHLIDQFAFALGKSMRSKAELVTCTSPRITPSPRKEPGQPIRILLHFDGGWPLKIYPSKDQETLIQLLHSQGFEITVLTKERQVHPYCQVHEFTNLDALKQLLQQQHLIIGMDSFPAHYAAHVLQIPTICLFSSTRPENANAPALDHFSILEKGRHCRPCNGFAKCPLYGGDICRNFVSPHAVLNAIEDVLHNKPHAITPKAARAFTTAPPTHQIHLRHLPFKSGWRRIFDSKFPQLRRLLVALKNTRNSLRVDGILLTYLRITRFLRNR